jgi:predicted DNA-binding transcriptional regulator AlpA
MDFALNNPVTYAVIEIRAKVLAQVKFLYDDGNGNLTEDNEYVQLLENPNPQQSKEDFLKQLEWYRCVYGWVYQKPYGAVGMKTSAIYNLNPFYCEFPKKKELKSMIAWTESDIKAWKAQKIKYKDPAGKEMSVEVGELLAFYDTANGLKDTSKHFNPLISPSRLESVFKPTTNTNLAMDAENVMIQTNGRELFSGGSDRGFNLGAALPMGVDDKESVEKNLIHDYGLTGAKKRSIATNQHVEWQSLHIKLKDLGLHESISSNSNLIREAYEVPNELYKAFQKGSTYENQKEALISFIQRTMQPIADDCANTWNKHFFEGSKKGKLVASFDHLPVMQHTEEKKAEKVLKIAHAMYRLTQAGMTPDQAREFIEQQGVNFQE